MPPTLAPDGRAPEPPASVEQTGVLGEIAQFWDAYKADGSPDARERLILHYAPLVKFVAGRVGAGLPSAVDQADLVSYGIFGLIDAIEKFDPARGIKFETYAVPRIRGAIIDELRAMDWVPRSVRAKAREIEQAISRLEAVHRREPTEEELAESIGITVAELRSRLGEVASLSQVALEELLTLGGDRGESVSLLDTLEDTAVEQPGAMMEAGETRQALLDAIDSLGDREKWVVACYYWEGLTLAQIGETLGVTESRVSQIHTKAVLFLRSRLLGTTGGRRR